MKKASSELLLLDVNVLLALTWPNHQFHVAANRRLTGSKGRWATCALTQLGFIRLSCNPTVVGVAKSPWEAASLLATLVRDDRHEYLDSLPSPAAKPFLQGFRHILGSRQVTDAYLLTLAQQHQATLVTFDSRLSALASSNGLVELLSSA